jgi:hypothetical protein
LRQCAGWSLLAKIWGLSSNGTESRIKLKQPFDLKAFEEPQFTASPKAGHKLKFSVRGQTQPNTPANKGISDSLFSGVFGQSVLT